jgi:hypothetical protein
MDEKLRSELLATWDHMDADTAENLCDALWEGFDTYSSLIEEYFFEHFCDEAIERDHELSKLTGIRARQATHEYMRMVCEGKFDRIHKDASEMDAIRAQLQRLHPTVS